MSTHRVTITVPDPEWPEDIEWNVEHLEDDPLCRVWYPCEKCTTWDEKKLSCRANLGLDADVVYHGEEHQLIEGDWMTPSTQCGLQVSDSCDWVDDIYSEHGPGTYPVEPDYWGEGSWIGCMAQGDGRAEG